MRRWIPPVLVGSALLGAIGALLAESSQIRVESRVTPRAALYPGPDDALIRFPLAPGLERYAGIDGRRMHALVVEQAAISRRYRDQGHPKFWGRITGTSSDAESAEWLAGKFTAAGLSDVRRQALALPPQWMPQRWEVGLDANGRHLVLESAQPAYRANALPRDGVSLDAVYVGLGSEADFLGKDVAGKAVFVFNMIGLRDEGALGRADERGAALIVEVDMLPGNMRYQAYPSGTKAPVFTVGSDDGFSARDLIVAAAGRAKVTATLDVDLVPNLSSALVWGTLPGATDETVYLVAHRDGWFDASGDNAGGVASIVGLAEYFAKRPRAERRRTLVFVGLDGHHNSGEGAGVGRRWMWDHRSELFTRTALMINAEHPSTVQTSVRPRYVSGDVIVRADTYMPQQWYAGGPSRRVLEDIAVKAFRDFGASMWLDPVPRPPAGDLGVFFRGVPGVATSEFFHYFHTDQETPDTVPWTGLEATTRAYAMIVDEVNRLDLAALQRPEEPVP
ncbi:MAG: M28 family peptidase [Vicinamibacterales bacterium]